MAEKIFLMQWADSSTMDNPYAFRNLSDGYDFFEVPNDKRIDDDEIGYFKTIEWTLPGKKYAKCIIIREVEIK